MIKIATLVIVGGAVCSSRAQGPSDGMGKLSERAFTARPLNNAAMDATTLAKQQDAAPGSCSMLAKPPLSGESHLMMTSLPSVYDLKDFVCAWDVPTGMYWWYSPLKKGSVNPIYGGLSGNAKAEVGQGWWLTPPKYVNVSADQRQWTSTSWVATRVPAFNHTSCCCQFMQADLDLKKFWLTEYCRAVVNGLDKSPQATCEPYASPCPVDNATAAQQKWPMPPYSESYSACLDPLGTALPIPTNPWPSDNAFFRMLKEYHLVIDLGAFCAGFLLLTKALKSFVRYLERPLSKKDCYQGLAGDRDEKISGA